MAGPPRPAAGRLLSVILRRTLTAPAQAGILLSLIVLGGTAGYMVIEGWSAWDAFYMTIITLTTVGYREVHPMSRAGEAFTATLLVGGVGTMLYSFTLIGARRDRGHPANPWERRRIMPVCSTPSSTTSSSAATAASARSSWTSSGVSGCRTSSSNGIPARIQPLREAGRLVIEGDASSEEVLTAGGRSRVRAG